LTSSDPIKSWAIKQDQWREGTTRTDLKEKSENGGRERERERERQKTFILHFFVDFFPFPGIRCPRKGKWTQ
jgi:hypothetical protein